MSPLGLSNPPITEPTWFKVKVPVLSLQIVVAEPMVSQADSLRTKALSAIIFCMEYARVKVTAKGKPSGTATTTIVTTMVKIAMNPSTTLSILVTL